MKKNSAAMVIALLLGTSAAVKLDLGKHRHHHHSLAELPQDYAQINSEAFADAAVQARIEADEDISNEVKHHRMVNSASHNKAWKKHFKTSEFYKKYAQHNEQHEKFLHNSAEKRKELVQVKSQYEELEQKFEKLKKDADKKSLDQFEKEQEANKQKKAAESKPPKDVKNLEIEEESPYGLAGGLYGPAYPAPQPFVRGEKQWMDNAQNIGDWGDMQKTVANTRIPYWSTLVQTNDDVLHEDIEDDSINLDILYEKGPDTPMQKKNEIEKLSATTAVPLDFHFVQTNQDDDPRKLEGFAVDDVPFNSELSLIESPKVPKKKQIAL